jgi:hypothetical protein
VVFEFDKATQVRAIGDGAFAARVHDGWDIAGNANGGYLLAIVSAAMCAATGRSLPVAVSCHYLGPVNDADVVIETSVVKSGKMLATAHATMRSGDRVIIVAIGTCGETLPGGAESSAALPSVARRHATRGAPQMPSFAESTPRPSTASGMPGLLRNVDVRLHPHDTGFARGEPSGDALVRGWCAFRDGRPIDALGLALMCDAFPPAVFNLSGAPGWVPTVQLSFYLRAIPAAGPVCAEFATNQLHDGMFEEDGMLWDSRGVLVAQSRQLALMPRQ